MSTPRQETVCLLPLPSLSHKSLPYICSSFFPSQTSLKYLYYISLSTSPFSIDLYPATASHNPTSSIPARPYNGQSRPRSKFRRKVLVGHRHPNRRTLLRRRIHNIRSTKQSSSSCYPHLHQTSVTRPKRQSPNHLSPAS